MTHHRKENITTPRWNPSIWKNPPSLHTYREQTLGARPRRLSPRKRIKANTIIRRVNLPEPYNSRRDGPALAPLFLPPRPLSKPARDTYVRAKTHGHKRTGGHVFNWLSFRHARGPAPVMKLRFALALALEAPCAAGTNFICLRWCARARPREEVREVGERGRKKMRRAGENEKGRGE